MSNLPWLSMYVTILLTIMVLFVKTSWNNKLTQMGQSSSQTNSKPWKW